MSTPPADTHTAQAYTTDTAEFAPVTGEHSLRPPVAIENDPPASVPSWEPEDGDFS